MSSSYSLYDMIGFPDTPIEGVIAAPLQLPLGLEVKEFDNPAKTEFTLLRTVQELDVNVYRVFHEFLVRKSGRAMGVSFKEYIENKYFPAYFHKKDKLLLLKVTKDVANSAMRSIKKSSDVDGDRRHINLNSIRPLIPSYQAAWFKVDDSADVNSQALFGPSVDRDMRFERATEEGEMNHIRFDYHFRSEVFRVGISEDSTISLLDDNLDEQLELELILNVKEKLLDVATAKPTR